MENDKKIISLDDTEYELLKEDIVGGNNFYMAAMVGDNRLSYITGTIDKTLAAAGREYYSIDGKSDDYMEVAEYYYGTLMRELQQVRESEPRDIPIIVLSSSDCNSIHDYTTLIGKLVVLNADVLYPEFQNSTHQLYFAKGGFGCNPEGTGNAIFAENLYTGESCRIERYEVIGVIKQDKLPQWAKDKLEEKESQKEKPKGEER